METLYAVIFVQGLVWGALLLRRSRPEVSILGFSFLSAGITGILTVIADAIFLIGRIREKTHTGSILDISNYRLHVHILVLKALFTAILLVALSGFTGGPGSPVLPDLIFQGVFAVMVFSTGYHAVQYSYLKKPYRKKQLRINPEQDLGNGLIRLLEEKKPYLDCELTLGKVADMLEMTEYELTRLLHSDMQPGEFMNSNS